MDWHSCILTCTLRKHSSLVEWTVASCRCPVQIRSWSLKGPLLGCDSPLFEVFCLYADASHYLFTFEIWKAFARSYVTRNRHPIRTKLLLASIDCLVTCFLGRYLHSVKEGKGGEPAAEICLKSAKHQLPLHESWRSTRLLLLLLHSTTICL